MPCWGEGEEVLCEMRAIGMLSELLAEVGDNSNV